MITTRELTFKYDEGNVALKNIHIDLNKGSIIGIIGVNGSGKSTLFMNMVGVLKPTSGTVLYNNQTIKYDKKSLRELRKKVGIVFQDPDKQIFYSKVYEDVAFALRNLGLDEAEVKRRVDGSLESVGAMAFKEQPIHFLSHGQKKRVAIASVIAMQNEVMLFDEPTAGLDPKSVTAIEDIIKDVSKRNTKVVISSHDMDLIYHLCDYIYVLDQGCVMREGQTEAVFTNDSVICEIGLAEPWLVKVHKYMGMPLFRKEEDLYAYYHANRKEGLGE
ncbi:energy-coupling factor ABC transporter ATP-binding protein [Cellulosilyticum sp. I15G10I2]|uniref:energy-coupling factor ABC transporter ATP-binding protein n=1 Tax=Cellulosilyticum sp. I15G10I2 TaxID=1892843 RepID=UPI00085C0F5F|nr:ATP-binding cassette domain-containing protein [Cellulosilyticum sp. I15G10I2]